MNQLTAAEIAFLKQMRPVRIADYAEKLFFKHSDRFLLMSATWISPQQAEVDLRSPTRQKTPVGADFEARF